MTTPKNKKTNIEAKGKPIKRKHKKPTINTEQTRTAKPKQKQKVKTKHINKRKTTIQQQKAVETKNNTYQTRKIQQQKQAI